MNSLKGGRFSKEAIKHNNINLADSLHIPLNLNGIKVVIMCAGEGKRWAIDHPKQLAIIEDKPNVVRTLSMLTSIGVPIGDICITVNELHLAKYPNNLPLTPVPQSNREIDRFRNAFHWLEQFNARKVIFLYGDVAYHQSDMHVILSTECDSFMGHIGGNNLTNKKWGEIQAVVTLHPAKFFAHVEGVASLYESNQIGRETGWEIYRKYQQEYVFRQLSDYTDDYDTIEEHRAVSVLYCR